ncbi:hypothetical protein K435DRAFT_863995 [Dendrothele bispora CBS 962.96]|uniref:Uncharacterized protein n=1 Tax=Dendrothele bispora (strain CBS 962.96) TaxID=1314807 RepID=A0A4S8LN83_DENBC|nr:hypothetical protein K435DRAFT_863995 [Dendrothele bispora CBS 962.96]
MSTANTPAWNEEDLRHLESTGDFSSSDRGDATFLGHTAPNARTESQRSEQSLHGSSVSSDLEQDQILSNPALLAIRIGTQKNLNLQQMQELQVLTTFVSKFVQGPDLLLAIFNLASQLQVAQLIAQMQSSINDLAVDLKDVKESQAETPKLSTEQKQQIARACNMVMFNVNRRSFDNNNITKDAYDKLKADRKSNGFNAHFKDPREDFRVVILNHCRQKATYSKARFRTAANTAIGNMKGVTATTAAVAKVMKGTHHSVTEDDTKLILVFRAFVEEVPDAFQPATKGAVHAAKRSRSDDDNVDEDDDDNEDDNVNDNAQIGSLFAKFEEWLRCKDQKFGSANVNSDQWKSFIQMRLSVEHSKFPNDKIAKIKLKSLPATAVFGNGRLGNMPPMAPGGNVLQEGAPTAEPIQESHFSSPSVFFGTRAPSVTPGPLINAHTNGSQPGGQGLQRPAFPLDNGLFQTPGRGNILSDSAPTTPQIGSTMTLSNSEMMFRDPVIRRNAGTISGLLN